MAVYVSLLRGINVGGNKLIRMAELRLLYESLGFTRVETLLQSGNVAFASDETDQAAIRLLIEAGIERQFGLHSDVFILSAAELNGVCANNPFLEEATTDPAKLVVQFFNAPPSEHALTRLQAANSGPDVIRSAGNILYIFFPEGQGRSKLATTPAYSRLGGTGRNWNTVSKLRDLAARLPPRTRTSSRSPSATVGRSPGS